MRLPCEDNEPAPQYTPGPWMVSESTNKDVYNGERHLVVLPDQSATRRYIICELETGPRAQADARLIAKAPQLLDCCKMLLDVIEQECDPDIWDSEIDHARGLIADAEGRP